ncbi:hypothetical protein HII36_39025 [Nonomuraea sp. NN258]|uniref:hypothetical protein n=1 Tax=Nonomuraea antri TaxID=2730852 RepID=UPI0015687CE4|nr:hypothetical protein [Nonomuraea antri]NRQ37781.1 hypothetical protein [Nonomuraea antri]
MADLVREEAADLFDAKPSGTTRPAAHVRAAHVRAAHVRAAHVRAAHVEAADLPDVHVQDVRLPDVPDTSCASLALRASLADRMLALSDEAASHPNVRPHPGTPAIFRLHAEDTIDSDANLRDLKGQERLNVLRTFLRPLARRRMGKPRADDHGGCIRTSHARLRRPNRPRDADHRAAMTAVAGRRGRSCGCA